MLKRGRITREKCYGGGHGRRKGALSSDIETSLIKYVKYKMPLF